MNTMTMVPPSEPGLGSQLLDALKARRSQFGPLSAIVVVHLLLFYLLISGSSLCRVAQAALPEVINISFIAPPPPPPKPSPATAPKMARLVAPQPLPRPVVPPPALPQLSVAPAEPTITPPVQMAEAAPVIAAAAPTVPVPAGPRTVSSVEYIKAPQPVYPSISRRLGESGTVVLRILISERGMPEQVIVQKSSGFSNLDEAGRQAALRALFKPPTEDGKPVSVFVIVPLNFQLS